MSMSQMNVSLVTFTYVGCDDKQEEEVRLRLSLSTLFSSPYASPGTVMVKMVLGLSTKNKNPSFVVALLILIRLLCDSHGLSCSALWFMTQWGSSCAISEYR